VSEGRRREFRAFRGAPRTRQIPRTLPPGSFAGARTMQVGLASKTARLTQEELALAPESAAILLPA
jgi:hypothetical protein